MLFFSFFICYYPYYSYTELFCNNFYLSQSKSQSGIVFSQTRETTTTIESAFYQIKETPPNNNFFFVLILGWLILNLISFFEKLTTFNSEVRNAIYIFSLLITAIALRNSLIFISNVAKRREKNFSFKKTNFKQFIKKIKLPHIHLSISFFVLAIYGLILVSREYLTCIGSILIVFAILNLFFLIMLTLREQDG